MGLESKSISTPDEVREFTDGKGDMKLLKLEEGDVGYATFEPGWRWSENVKPIAGTDSCQVNHVGYVVKGRMKIVMDDGTEAEVGPGDAVHIPPGHDAWIVGDEACEIVDWGGPTGYAKPAE